MKAKHALSLLVSFILSTGIALAQQTPKPPAPSDNSNDDLVDESFSLVVMGDGFLGVYAEDITKENMSRYSLNQVRGVAVSRIVKDSPAEKAGLRKDDVILRIDNEPVTSVRRLNRLVSEIAPDQTVRVAISRGGAEQEIVATMGRRSSNSFGTTFGDGLFKGDLKNFGRWDWEGAFPNHDGAFTFAFGASRRIGIGTTELTKQLAEFFGVPGGKGVLVTSVSEGGPAAQAGIKAGDVLTAVDGESIDSTGDISRILNQKKEGDVTLTVIRSKSQQSIRVTPKAGGLSTGTIESPQIGRRIVIPRVVVEMMPEINIEMPRIEIPSIPAININMPKIKVMPKVRMIKRSGGPI